MTVASAVAKVGPYAGNGSQTVFAYTFKVFADSELQVVLRSAAGVETVQTLTTHYTVSGVGQDAGGNVTMVTAPPTGATLTIVRNVPFTQATDLRNQGGFYPEVHERVFDRLTMQTQQLSEEVGRAVKLTVASPIDPDVFNQSINTLAENVDDVNAVAAAISDVQTVAAIDGDVQAVAANVTDVTNFADVYYGPNASDPTLRRDGSALQAADLYFNTASAKIRAYTGSVWVDSGTPIPLTIATQQFNGTGSQTVFALSAAPAFAAALDVYISGVSQKLTADYSVSGTTLTFVAAPPAGTNNIYVKILSAYAGGVPNDGSVTTVKVADGAVTFAKIQNITTARVLGRATAGSGAIEELDAATARTVIGVSDQWVQISSTAITAVNQIDLTWTGGAYLCYKIYILGLRPSTSTASDLFMRVRRGGTFVAGASDYAVSDTWWNGTAAGVVSTTMSYSLLAQAGMAVEPFFGETNLLHADSAERIIIDSKTRHTSNSGFVGTPHSHSWFTANTGVGSGWLDGLRIGFVGGGPNFAAVGCIVVMGMKS